MSPILGIFASQGRVAANSYDSIATQIVGAGGASSVTFSSIPSTYKHLQIRAISRTSGTPSATNYNLLHLQFNGDTGNNYSTHRFEGNGSSVSATGSGNQPIINGGIGSGSLQSTNVFGTSIIDILEYTNTNINKTTRGLGGGDGNGDGVIAFLSGSWRNTAAITSITLFPQANSFVQYSQFALYGIKA